MNQAGFTPIIAQPRRWDVLAAFMAEQGYKSFVEVGCKEGRTTGHILKSIPEASVIAIDPWIVQAPSADKTRETYEKWDFEKIEREFWENVGEHRERCKMLKMTGHKAAYQHAEKSDLVFIDALHDYDSVYADIHDWWPHVRVGGMLAGHDFNHQWPGVERAVSDCFDLMQVGVTSDSVWFVIKQSEDQLRAKNDHA